MSAKVSINLCCHNSEQYLRETLSSLVAQNYHNWELVVINDGSSDATESIIFEYKEQGYPIVYHYQKNMGLGFSRNKALELSNGDYIAFIDHDDLWLPDKLAKQVSVLETNLDIDFVYSNLRVLKNRRETICFSKKQPQGHVFNKFLMHYPVAVLTVMVRKSALEKMSVLFDTNLKLSEEFDLFMRFLYKSKAVYIDEPLASYRVHRNMGSLKYIERWPDEMTYIIAKLKDMDDAFTANYAKELRYMEAKIEYYKARAAMMRSNVKNAREYLRPYAGIDHKFLFLFLMTYFPPVVWRKVHALLTTGAFSEMS